MPKKKVKKRVVRVGENEERERLMEAALDSLSQSKRLAYVELRERVSAAQWETDQDFQVDSTFVLLRYLRAREFVVEKAFGMLQDTVAWRAEFKPAEISLDTDSEVRGCRQLGGMYSNGHDKEGRPVVYVRPGGVNPNSPEARVRYLVYVLEKISRQTPVGKFTWVCDFSEYGSRGKSPGGLHVAKESIHILQCHYPERLGQLYLVNTPFLFSAVYTMFSMFLAKETKEKIQWVSGNEETVHDCLTQHIDPDQLDERFGGCYGGSAFLAKLLAECSPTLFCAAPMVDYSDLAFREQVRRHGVGLCWTEMLNSSTFASSAKYRRRMFPAHDVDRGAVVVQFSGNDPDVLAAAVREAQGRAVAVELNMGCPQRVARNGRYGAYLVDDMGRVEQIVRAMRAAATQTPLFCKIRVLPDRDQTIAYAQLLERCGCDLLSVHGRTRDQKGDREGSADLDAVAAIKRAVSIPVVCNGNVRSLADALHNARVTGCDGVMSATGLLANRHLFDSASEQGPVAQALEYLDLCASNPVYAVSSGRARNHILQISRSALEPHKDLLFAVYGASKGSGGFATIHSAIRELDRRTRANVVYDPEIHPFTIVPPRSKKRKNKEIGQQQPVQVPVPSEAVNSDQTALV